MNPFQRDSLVNDPIHGYIPFTSTGGVPNDEVAEQQIIDHPWLQRLRQIHQLQTAWWVFPAAEHTRFQHVLGAMHLASRWTAMLDQSLRTVCPDTPSRGYIDVLMRMAALLHDVGHGPFGHFFDAHFLKDFGLNHELLGGQIIRRELGPMLRGVRRSPNAAMEPGETLDPEQIAVLIARPRADQGEALPEWLRLLRCLFSGLYTVDNMDFVLRDAYMSGYSARAFDLQRLLHYSTFTPAGLTIHERGLSSLVRFIAVRGELFQAIYFHRTVRAIDLDLQGLFADSKKHLFPGNPLDHLDEYQRLTEWSILVRVSEWSRADDPVLRDLGLRWQKLLRREVQWKMACERTIVFRPGVSERSSVFSDAATFESAVRGHLPDAIRAIPLKVDTARLVHRPGAHAPAAGQNFLYDTASDEIRGLDDRELFRQLPVSFRICRVYAQDNRHDRELARAMDRLLQSGDADDVTNM
ncbi:MAG: HD domain-containing protein [Pirellulaceae bacterium]|nr:HD domain-containing protein [Pirellulaceae bacterium]